MPELADRLRARESPQVDLWQQRAGRHPFASPEGNCVRVAQQFAVAKTVCAVGLVPIIEPEVNIHSEQQSECENDPEVRA